MSESYHAYSNDDSANELYGVMDADNNWVIKPVLPSFVCATVLAERMNLCAQLATGCKELTVPVLARLGIDPILYENFHVYA